MMLEARNATARADAWIARGLGVLALAMAFLACVPSLVDAAGFGIQSGSFSTSLSGGGAGEHADLTVSFALNQEPPGDPAGYLKDITELALPPGLVGNPTAAPLCDMGDVEKRLCAEETAVGVAEITLAQPPHFEGVSHVKGLVYGIAPYPEEPAAYAFDISNLAVRFDASLPAKNGYGLTMSATDISDAKPLIAATITFWGVPADHMKPICHVNEETEEEECEPYGGPRLPFLSNPVACGETLESSLSADSWQGAIASTAISPTFGPIAGCGGVRFEPSVSVVSESKQAVEPTGYEVAVDMPINENPEGRADGDLRSARLALPSGTVISPSATEGLQACSDDEFAVNVSSPATCPSGSQLGTVMVKTPLLTEAMQGRLFLGVPECGPCTSQDAQEGRMIRVLVQASGSGVVVKLRGAIHIDQSTGRLTLVLDESPQLPIEELKLALNGGPRALLANPSVCAATQRGSAQLTPYSSETPTEVTAAPFVLTGCHPSQFAPTLSAGTVSNVAASSSPAIVSIGRSDVDQTLERFIVHMPPGLMGLLSKVPLCPSAPALSGDCPSQSKIGTVQIAAGPGEDPLSLQGSVFLTGPYEGAPFGLSIVTPAQAGPIDLGIVNIHAGIEVDPTTAALTIVSGAVPQSLAGVPLQIRGLNLDLDREGFIVNPTSCRPMAIDATVISAQGASAADTQHFQAARCAKLAFKPRLSALANAKATRIGGASMHVKVASAPGQSNIAKVKLDLPKALPSRLTTLQGACREATFKADPADCPASSVVGTGAVTTPFLRAVLRGPVYLVSHGSRAFPDLDAVLQGEGVTLDLIGTTTFTNGASAEAFRSLPDAPISSLDLMFPEGRHSAFAANANLCTRALNMPTEITGQNGAVVKHTTKIAVSGCAHVRHATHKRKGATR